MCCAEAEGDGAGAERVGLERAPAGGVEAGEVAERRGEPKFRAGRLRGGGGGGREVGDDGLEEGDGPVDVPRVDQVVHLLRPAVAAAGRRVRHW